MQITAPSTSMMHKSIAMRAPRVSRNTSRITVRAQVSNPSPTPPESTPEVPSTSAPAQAVALPLENPELFTVMGPLQEAINSRSAMVGFVAAVVLELNTHQAVISQLGGRYVDGELVERALAASDISFAFVVAVITIATFAPLVYKGQKPGDRSFGPFSPELELKVGRVAQLGFLGLVLVEILKGGTSLF